MKSILILFHCESNTGYAIGPLERLFYDMALKLSAGDRARVHFAYPSMARGPSPSVPPSFDQYLVVDMNSTDPSEHARAAAYMRTHGIDTILGFEQPVARPIYRDLRRAGVQHFISYWGAPMSSVNAWWRRSLKRIEVALQRHGPDHYIFESRGMAETAVLGRGIPARRTSVVYLGTDISRFHPDVADSRFVYEQLGVPSGRRIFFYSGHMEARKGVAVIMLAANQMAACRAANDWHIALFGNKEQEHLPYLEMLTRQARQHVSFGGYRSDLDRIQRGCYAGIIASTGWDSLTMSSMEMQASGLPLLISDLRGWREAIETWVPGLVFPPGDATALTDHMQRLLDEPQLRARLGAQARARVAAGFTTGFQLRNLVNLVGQLTR